MLKKRKIHGAIRFGNANTINKVTNRFRRIATTTHRAKCGHAWIIPSAHIATLHKHAQITLGHDGARDVQSAKLNLAWTGRKHVRRLFHHPVIEGAMVFVFERTHAVGDPFKRIADGVGKVVHGIDAPIVSCAVMLLIQNTIHRRVTHIDVGARHINLHAKNHATLFVLALFHFFKQTKAFFHRAIPIRAIFARFGQRATIGAHFLCIELANIGKSTLDPIDRDIIAMLIIFARKKQATLPVKTEPVNVFHDAVDILGFFLGRIGVIKTQIGQPSETFGRQKVCYKRLAMPNVQIPIGLWRKTGVHTLVTPAF